jgi:hypothetical protein
MKCKSFLDLYPHSQCIFFFFASQILYLLHGHIFVCVSMSTYDMTRAFNTVEMYVFRP